MRIDEIDQFRQWYADTIVDKVGRSYHAREAFWSDALAIGEKRWKNRMVGKVSDGKRVNIKSESVPAPSESSIGEPTTVYYASS